MPVEWEPYRRIRPEDGIPMGRARCGSIDERGRCRRKREYVSFSPGGRVYLVACASHAGLKEPRRRKPVPLEDPAYLQQLEREMEAFYKGRL